MELQNPIYKEDQNLKFSRLRIIKNLTVISFSFVLLFTGYDGLSMLQSTMNKMQGVGTVSQAVIYISFGLSSLLLPNFVIKKLGAKNTLFMAMIFYLPYIAANLHPVWETLIPSAVLIGIGASILWGAQCTYFNECSVIYCTDDYDVVEILDYVPDPISNHTSLEKLSESGSIRTGMDDLTARNSVSGLVNCQLSIRNLNLKSVEELNVRNLNGTKVNRPSETVIISKSKQTLKRQMENKAHLSEDNKAQKEKDVEFISEQHGISVITSEIPETEIRIQTGKINSVEVDRIPRKDTNDSEIFETYSAIDSANACFFGCHGLAYYSAQVWSNLMSFYVLHRHVSHNFTRTYVCLCGADYCDPEPECINDDTDDVTTDLRYLLTGICLGVAVVAALLIFFFLDPLNKSKDPVMFSWDHVFATFHHTKKKEQLYLIPLTLYVGMAQGFYTADVTKSYVACAWGTSHIGLVTIFYGLACALSSTISGCLVQFMGRIPIFLLGQIGNIVNYTFLLMWSPEVHHPSMFYVAAALWGIITGLFWSQLQAFYGVLFQGNEEAAFGCYYLFTSLGWTLSFLISNYVCTNVKIYLLSTVSCVGIITYLLTERNHHLKKMRPHIPH